MPTPPARRVLAAVLVAGIALSGSAAAHDMFLRLGSFFVAAHARVTVRLLNGTFDESENAIARDRMLDVSVAGPGEQVSHPETSQWHDVDQTALLEIETGPPGTYVIGVSTAERVIELSAEDFNDYLAHDGVDDVLSTRQRNGDLGDSARERYSKHVKAIVQVDGERSEAFDTRLGYPIEIVPRQNPYELSVGDELEVVVLEAGAPLEDQLVYASHAGFHGHDEAGRHTERVKTRTDARGIASIPLTATGQWYVRLIRMIEVEEPDVDYESNWATLTFEVRAQPEAGGPAGMSLSLFLIGIATAVLLLFALRSRS